MTRCSPSTQTASIQVPFGVLQRLPKQNKEQLATLFAPAVVCHAPILAAPITAHALTLSYIARAATLIDRATYTLLRLVPRIRKAPCTSTAFSTRIPMKIGATMGICGHSGKSEPLSLVHHLRNPESRTGCEPILYHRRRSTKRLELTRRPCRAALRGVFSIYIRHDGRSPCLMPALYFPCSSPSTSRNRSANAPG